MFRFKQSLLILFAALASGFLVRTVYRALASPETKIRWRIESMIDGFNAERTKRVLRGISSDYVDHTTGFRRTDLHSALVHVFFSERDRETKSFALEAELLPEALEVRPLEDEEGRVEHAEVELGVAIRYRSSGEDWWIARIQGELRRIDGDWRWTSTDGVNHGDRPRRFR